MKYQFENDSVATDILSAKETAWINPYFLPFDMVDGVSQLTVSDGDIADAEARLRRFAPFIRKKFPETLETDGLIESPLAEIKETSARLPLRLTYTASSSSHSHFRSFFLYSTSISGALSSCTTSPVAPHAPIISTRPMHTSQDRKSVV